jgi:ketosteroid isomerase-like protein
MSELEHQAVTRIHQSYEAFNRGDFDAAVRFFHPDVELYRAAGLPPVIGSAAVREWAEPDAMLDARFEALEFRVNANKVLVRQRSIARGASSGVELNLLNWAVWTFDESGRVTRLENFLDHEEADAARAAGLPE